MARTLSLCGLELPRTLMAANAFNEDGHWESEVVKTSNDALLQEADSAWDDALALRSNRAAKVSRRAIETIKAAVRSNASYVRLQEALEFSRLSSPRPA